MSGVLVRDREQWQSYTQIMLQADEVAVRFYYSITGDFIAYSAAWGSPGEVQAVYVPLQHVHGVNVKVSLRELSHFFTEANLLAASIRSHRAVLQRLLGCVAHFVGDPLLVRAHASESFHGLAQAVLGTSTSQLEEVFLEQECQIQEVSSEDATLLERATRDARILLDLHRELLWRCTREEEYRKDLLLDRVAWEMSEEGYLVDWPGLYFKKRVAERGLTAAKSKVQSYVGDHVNPSASGQMVRALFDPPAEGGLGLPVLVRTPVGERPSLSRDALKALEGYHPVVGALQEYKAIKGIGCYYETVVRARQGERIHSLWGMQDRRFLSSKPDCRWGRGEIYTCFSADSGTRWVGFEYPHALFQFLACAFGEGPLLDISRGGEGDPFQVLSEQCGLPRDQVVSLLVQIAERGFAGLLLSESLQSLSNQEAVQRLGAVVPGILKMESPTQEERSRFRYGADWAYRDILLYLNKVMGEDAGETWVSSLRCFLPTPSGLFFEVSKEASLEEVRTRFHEPCVKELEYGLRLVPQWVEGFTVGACLKALKT